MTFKTLKQQQKANQPTYHQCLILLEIRGQLLYVKNSSTAVTLGLTKEPDSLTVPHPDLDPLLWFCTQLKQAMELMMQQLVSTCCHCVTVTASLVRPAGAASVVALSYVVLIPLCLLPSNREQTTHEGYQGWQCLSSPGSKWSLKKRMRA